MHQASPDCEQFHPSSYQPSLSRAPADPYTGQLKTPYEYIANPELYLKETFSGFELRIVIPRRANEQAWHGAVVIQGRFGEQIFGFASLDAPGEIPVLPKLEPYRFSQRENVGAIYWCALSHGIPGLLLGANCFRLSGLQGRRLGPVEDMFWGETYQVMLPPGARVPDSLSHLISHIGELGSWQVLELTLPSSPESLLNFQAEEIRKWVLHDIRERPPQAILIDPLPHHFDAQGAFVLPQPVDEVRFFIDGGYKNVLVLTNNDDELHWDTKADGTILVSPNGTSNIFVLIDGAVRLALSLEHCALFSPCGIRVKTKNSETELFASEATLGSLRNNLTSLPELQLKAPNDTLLHLVRVNGKQFDSIESLKQAFLDVNSDFEIDASNFGRVYLSADSKEGKEFSLKAQVRDRISWLLTLPFPAPGEVTYRFPGNNREVNPDWFRALCARS